MRYAAPAMLGRATTIVLLSAVLVLLDGSQTSRALELPIGMSFGWASPHGTLDGTIRPGWRIWVGLTGDLPDNSDYGATLGVHHFHFPAERPGHLIANTPYTLYNAIPTTMGFLFADVRHTIAKPGRFRPFVEAGLGLGYMTVGYDAIGPDSTGLWGDGVGAFGASVGAGTTLRLMSRLKLSGELRLDAVGHPGVGMMIYSVNAGPVVLVHVPGLSEMSPGWNLRRRGPSGAAKVRNRASRD